MASENFTSVYALVASGPGYVVDGTPPTNQDIFTATNVLSEGDAIQQYSPSPYGPDGNLTYLGVATDPSGLVIGFIATDDTSGQEFLFSQTTTFTPSMAISALVSTGVGDPMAANWNINQAVTSPDGNGGAASFCFMAGTRIRTPDGDVAVETLQAGDLVTLSDGRVVPVTWLGIQTIAAKHAHPIQVLPIRIKAGALGDAMPQRDLLVSAEHALLIGDILIQAAALVNGVSIIRETDVPKTFVYYHVEVADHSLILAENVPAETFVDNVDRMGFDNWAEHKAMYGEVDWMVEMDYPRAKARRHVPQAVRSSLLARGEALYGMELAAAA